MDCAFLYRFLKQLLHMLLCCVDFMAHKLMVVAHKLMVGQSTAILVHTHPEHKALERSYKVLVKGIQLSPGGIRTALTPLGIWSQEDVSYLSNESHDRIEHAKRIVDVMMNKVKIDSSIYRDIINILEEEVWLKATLNVLKQNYKQLVPPDTDSSDSSDDSDCDESDTGDDSQNLYSSQVKSKSSFELSQLSSTCRGEDLEFQTEQIRGQFASLITSAMMSIPSNRDRDEHQNLIFFLSELKAFQAQDTDAKRKCMLFNEKHIRRMKKKCSSVRDVFESMRGYYSWFDFRLIEKIINTFCKRDPEINKSLNDYKAALETYCKARLHRNVRIVAGPTDRYQCVFLIDCKYRQMRISTIQNISTIICNVFELTEREALQLHAVEKGSVILIYTMPQHVANIVFPLTRQQVEALEQNSIYSQEGTIYTGSLSSRQSLSTSIIPAMFTVLGAAIGNIAGPTKLAAQYSPINSVSHLPAFSAATGLVLGIIFGASLGYIVLALFERVFSLLTAIFREYQIDLAAIIITYARRSIIFWRILFTPEGYSLLGAAFAAAQHENPDTSFPVCLMFISLVRGAVIGILIGTILSTIFKYSRQALDGPRSWVNAATLKAYWKNYGEPMLVAVVCNRHLHAIMNMPQYNENFTRQGGFYVETVMMLVSL